MALFIPTYFSPIAQYSEIVKTDTVTFEMEDNFQKQSYRNRCYIFNSNGKQLLSIPVKHKITNGRKKTKDTLIENNVPWQDQHFKSLQIAYRTSPFFEFFEDDLAIIFEKKYKFLQDINIDTFLFIIDALQFDINFIQTTTFNLDPKQQDFRYLAEVKKQPEKLVDKYIQMFDDKHGFLPNLSVLDLLFMEGPNSVSYL
ncbi:WbqC family protein [Polaribacter cellanae]|uniref:WbqC family protein n=1 Tax=Polaribacter cellanae TaxID=2818493 RepID=A0A975CN15_9FLAO|nr:WbqC family protein [Polaribacter cellanae]QTE22339.1 WbqC family protein [Polaribacter cellanae]